MSKIAYRKQEAFVADDGRRVSMITKSGEIDSEHDVPEEMISEGNIFIGHAQVSILNRPQELTFQIEADSLEDAFAKFEGELNKAAAEKNEEYKKLMKELMEKQNNQIVPATENDLQTIDHARSHNPMN